MNFLDVSNIETILFTVNSSGILTPMYEFPDGFKTKVFYFLKLEPVAITETNIETTIITGDVSTNPIEDIKTLTEKVSENSRTIYDVRPKWKSVVKFICLRLLCRVCQTCLLQMKLSKNIQTTLQQTFRTVLMPSSRVQITSPVT